MKNQSIEVLLRGGLGNQLFGFAAGLEVARRNGLPLRLVTQNYVRRLPGNRAFELDSIELDDLAVSTAVHNRKVFRERSFSFDSRIDQVSKPVLLDGYFQSSRYFSLQRRAVVEAICATSEFQNGSCFAGESFIGIQARRGDYLQEPQKSFHGLVTLDYFKESLAILRSRVGNLPAIVFSDDSDFAKFLARNLTDADIHQPQPRESPLTTLASLASAMALSISNSSFGWWAAFLARSGGPVICPRPWFQSREPDTADLLEPSWLSLGYSNEV